MDIYDDGVRTIDFAVRALAREAGIDSRQLSALEPLLLAAAAELDGSFAGLDPTGFATVAEHDITAFNDAMRRSASIRQQELYASSRSKLTSARPYGLTAITVGASIALIIVALRLKVLKITQHGIEFGFHKNEEPLSQSIKAAAEYAGKILSSLARPATPPGNDDGAS